MTCAACSGIIETEVKRLSGVKSAAVNFATENAELQTSSEFDLDVFHGLLKKLGYRAIDPNQKEQAATSFLNIDFFKAVAAIILASITMFFAMVIMNNLIQAVLTTILIFGFGMKYVLAVFRFQFNMYMLIGLGVLSSYIYSMYLIINFPHAHSYFEGAAFIIAFSILGQYLDGLAKTKARSNLSSLFKMQIKFASLILDGKEINTPVVELKAEDIIRIRPGEKFPLDGVIVDGSSHSDESMLTGESQAVAKTSGSQVYAGSMNLEGSVSVKITTTIHETVISEIVSFVEKAQLKKAPIEKYADKIVKVFVPIILVIAALTFVMWYLFTNQVDMSVTHMVAVLVIACPCALGLAVPMAIMISTSEAAKNGLLISGGDIVEKGSHIDTIIFDKTGTLTEGQPKLTNIFMFDKDQNEDDVLKIAASSVQFSTHPLSQSITNVAFKRDFKLSDPDKFKSLTGLGIIAEIGGKKIFLGNADLIKQETGNDIPENFFKENIGSYVFMATDERLTAAFVINDPIKKNAPELIQKLKTMDIDVWMVTGDHPNIAHKIGEELGISKEFIRAGAKPNDKAAFVTELQSKNHKVAMIGDGINDAPALARANVSMAMSNGSDVALEASDVSLLDGNILLVAYFFQRSKRTMKIIKENLALSFFYNVLCVPLAAGAFYYWYKVSLTPMWASLAMALSSFSVIANSFRVKKL